MKRIEILSAFIVSGLVLFCLGVLAGAIVPVILYLLTK